MTENIKLYTQGDGPALTLIHGWGMNAAVFQPLAEVLAGHYRVTRVDLPGYGGSPWNHEDFETQIEQLAAALADSMLVGWSLGGLYAQRLASLYPQRFTRLILLNSNPCFVQRDDWLCAVKAEVFEQFAASLAAGWQATIRRFLALQMRGNEHARQLVRQITQLLIEGGEPHPDVLPFGLKLLLECDARTELAALAVPVMHILGERDTLVPACVGEQIHRTSPSIRVECLARCAHAPFLSHSDLVISLIREFAQSSPP
jgi:pimeloyl-[acyl-carrier protein] methyl ester esterase